MKNKARCPDCGATVEATQDVCCDTCWTNRVAYMDRCKHLPCEGKSSPPEWEAAEHVTSEPTKPLPIGMRHDARMKTGKHRNS